MNRPRGILPYAYAAVTLGGLSCLALVLNHNIQHRRNQQLAVSPPPGPVTAPGSSVLPGSPPGGSQSPGSSMGTGGGVGTGGVGTGGTGDGGLAGLGLGLAPNTPGPLQNPFSAPSTAARSLTHPAPGPNAMAPAPGVKPVPGGKPGQPASADPSTNKVLARFQQGAAAHQKGKTTEALAAYQDVLRQKPDFTQAYLNLSMLYLQMQRPQDALDQLKLASQHDPKNPAVPYQQAQTLMAVRRLPEALAPMQEVVHLAPKSRPARAALAQLLLALHRPAASYVEWARLAAADPRDGEAALAAGSIAFNPLQRNAEAEKWLRQAALKAPKDPRAPLTLGRVLATEGKLVEAESILKAGAHQFPEVIELLTLLSDVRWARGNKSGAIDAMWMATQAMPAKVQHGVPLARLHAALGRLYALTGQWQPATAQLQAAVTLLPREPEPRAMLAEAMLRGGDRAGAAGQMQQVLQLDPKRLGTRLALANVLVALGRPDDAQTQYSAYLKAKPRDFAVIMQQAALYERQHDSSRAIATYNHATQLWPEHPQPPLHRAQLLSKAGRDDEALQWYRYVLQVKPGYPDALAGAAAIEEKRGAPMQALTHLRSLVAARPEDAAAYASLLRVAASKAQLPATINFLKLQLASDPSRRAACAALLKCYEMTGQADDGRAAVKAIIDRHPHVLAPRIALNEFDLARARKKLAELRKAGATPRPAASPTPAGPPPAGSTPNPPSLNPGASGETSPHAATGEPDKVPDAGAGQDAGGDKDAG